MPDLPPVAERFLRYVQIDTQSDPDAASTPSTEKQKDLGHLLVQELQAMGAETVYMDAYGYVFATIPASLPSAHPGHLPTLALLAHLDTSPDAPGAGVKPVVHFNYDGGVLTLPGDPAVTLDPARQPALLQHVGEDLITSDGTTLLGSDDKAGVAILLQLAEDLLREDATPRPTLRLCFTVDEEIGRGVDRLDLAQLSADVGYTLDGSGIGSLSVETFNAAEAVLTVEGVSVHPGYAKGVMVNAIRILCDVLAQLPADEAPETTAGAEGYLHPHALAEASPARASAKLILRDFTAAGLARRKGLLKRLVEIARVKYPKAHITLQVRDQYKNMRTYIEERDPRAITFAFRAAETMGLALHEERVRGGTDGARLSELGLPTPNVFNGGYDYHSCFEWNTVQNLERSLAYTKALVRYWAEHGHEAPA
jgi:tripeptide aminopeptidase